MPAQHGLLRDVAGAVADPGLDVAHPAVGGEGHGEGRGKAQPAGALHGDPFVGGEHVGALDQVHGSDGAAVILGREGDGNARAARFADRPCGAIVQDQARDDRGAVVAGGRLQGQRAGDAVVALGRFGDLVFGVDDGHDGRRALQACSRPRDGDGGDAVAGGDGGRRGAANLDQLAGVAGRRPGRAKQAVEAYLDGARRSADRRRMAVDIEAQRHGAAGVDRLWIGPEVFGGGPEVFGVGRQHGVAVGQAGGLGVAEVAHAQRIDAGGHACRHDGVQLAGADQRDAREGGGADAGGDAGAEVGAGDRDRVGGIVIPQAGRDGREGERIGRQRRGSRRGGRRGGGREGCRAWGSDRRWWA